MKKNWRDVFVEVGKHVNEWYVNVYCWYDEDYEWQYLHEMKNDISLWDKDRLTFYSICDNFDEMYVSDKSYQIMYVNPVENRCRK